LDEASGAYKDIDVIMANQQDLMKVLVKWSHWLLLKDKEVLLHFLLFFDLLFDFIHKFLLHLLQKQTTIIFGSF